MKAISIAKGNTKMGRVPSISLPPIKACSRCAAKYCGKACYAMKAYRMYKQTKAAYDRNYEVARTDPNEYFRQVEAFLARVKPSFFRFHVSGDFLDQDYVNRAYVLARKFPEIKFLAFTKRFELSFAGRPENFTIVFSAWPGMHMRRRAGIQVAWMQDGTETRVPANALECPGNCETCAMCWNLSTIKRDVVFNKH